MAGLTETLSLRGTMRVGFLEIFFYLSGIFGHEHH
jgi:hypothetical protein